jgi:hypothetical protein
MNTTDTFAADTTDTTDTTTRPETARELTNRLLAAGWTEEAIQVARKATSRARHDWRVRQTLEAAGAAFGMAEAACLILLDMHGIGGPCGAGGAGCRTDRAPWARSLGSGRWQASDGDSYRAAAKAALQELDIWPGAHLSALQTDGEVQVALHQGSFLEPVLGSWDRAWFESQGLLPWLMAYAKAQLIENISTPEKVAEWSQVLTWEPPAPVSEERW